MNLLVLPLFLLASFCTSSVLGAPTVDTKEELSVIEPPKARITEISQRSRNLSESVLAEELSGEFEGDILLTEQQYRDITRRNGRLPERYRWPNKVVFYQIEDYAFYQDQLDQIYLAMQTIEAATCVRFQQRYTTTADYVYIVEGSSGCSSFVGRIGGVQELKLFPDSVGTGCFRLGTIMHELIHAIGFRHMQSTYNRDDYVRIMWENLQPGSEHNFQLYGSDQVSNFGTAYDYGSIMHYSATAFSINGQKTIVALKETNQVMGQRNGLSQTDILKIKKMYNCA
ncbi:hypothetical protein pipiens_017775 [Culex pipiens pipiens]|uniref:Metalloendopeptidase n=1 Tax=Culex pipiens pipiens TaxID=38569 RepID=A0ABD1CF40_CULPP